MFCAETFSGESMLASNSGLVASYTLLDCSATPGLTYNEDVTQVPEEELVGCICRVGKVSGF